MSSHGCLIVFVLMGLWQKQISKMLDFYKMMYKFFGAITFLWMMVLQSQVYAQESRLDTTGLKYVGDKENFLKPGFEGVGGDVIDGPTPWFRALSFRGYAQLRYNRLLETNPDLGCDCDGSWGDGGGFGIRRVRLTFEGNISEKVYLYLHPDIASGGGQSLFSLRSAFFDVGIDDKQEFRIRFGQTKVPFGFENGQSTQKRLPLDRSESLNSAKQTERDLGVFLYWAPIEIRKRLAWLVSSGLKGTGDYGVLGFAVYNGMTANREMLKNSPHVAAKASYPFQFKNGQVLEAGISGYTGKYPVNTTLVDDPLFRDQRIAASFIYYPQPLGFSGEYNIGEGPQYNRDLNTVESKPVKGGYLQTMYYVKTYKYGLLIPFARWHNYDGGFKHRPDAIRQDINEFDIGFEWQPNYHLELSMHYTISERNTSDSTTPFNDQRGNLLRVQFQVNF